MELWYPYVFAGVYLFPVFPPLPFSSEALDEETGYILFRRVFVLYLVSDIIIAGSRKSVNLNFKSSV